MKFEKKGIICNSERLGLCWAGKNIMAPLPIVLPNLLIIGRICSIVVTIMGVEAWDGRNW